MGALSNFGSRLGQLLKLDFSKEKFSPVELAKGYKVELEHGTQQGTPDTNVTQDDPKLTTMIALAHLREDPFYYRKLAVMEGEGAEKIPLPAFSSEAVQVFLVDGERVRDEHSVEFIGGGHYYRYPSFIPVGEVWVENAMDVLGARALALVIFHELYERALMAKGQSYGDAHAAASRWEKYLRQFKDEIPRKLRQALDLNKNVV